MVRSQAVQYTIAGFARAAGVGVETVRYYQRRGLLETPAQAVGSGIRRYDEEALRRLRFIRRAQMAGFTLEQIRELLALDAGRDRARVRRLAREQIAALDEKIAELTQARVALGKLARACSAGERGRCPILESFAD
jgi:MerR family mercuric resistance operon transcriptional regulator